MENFLRKTFCIPCIILIVLQAYKCDPLDDILTQQWDLVTTTYLRYDATKAFLEIMKKSFPELVDFYSIGKSVQGREMYVAKLAQDVTKEKPPSRPLMRLIANIHGDETLGRWTRFSSSEDPP